MTRRELYQAFQKEFPLVSLKDMPLERYTNLNKDDSFCYWIESRTDELGSFGVVLPISSFFTAITRNRQKGTLALLLMINMHGIATLVKIHLKVLIK